MDQDSNQPSPAPTWTPEPGSMQPQGGMPAPVPVAPTARKGPSARILNLILGGALVLAVAGIAFAVGRMTAPAPAAATRGNFPGGVVGNGYFGNRGTGGGGGGFAGGALGAAGGGVTVEGTVDAISSDTLTLKLASGQTIQIALAPTTTYHAQTDATSSAITTGGKVLVRINLRAPNDGETVSGPSANDVTVVP